MSSKAKIQSKPRNKAPNKPKPRNNQLVIYTMDNPQVQGVYTSELGQILKRHIDEKVKPFRKECREIARGELEFTPVPKSPKGKEESKPRGKQQQSINIAKKEISFEFVGDQEALRRFPGIEGVLSKLGGWKIRGVKRELEEICDTYYWHETLGTKNLRSVNEVVNHLLPEGYPKLHSKKGKIKENEVKDENHENLNLESREKRKRRKGENKVKEVFLGSSSSSQKNDEKSIILSEVSVAESSKVKEVSRKRKNKVSLGSSSSQKNEEKSIILREVSAVESSKVKEVSRKRKNSVSLGSSSSSQKNDEKSIILKEVPAAESSEDKEVSRKRKNSVFLGPSSSSSSSQKNEEKSIIVREVSAESSEVQIVIPSDDERLEDMLNNDADNDKCIVAVGNKMDEDLDEIIEEFPEYDDLANQFFN